MKQQQGTLYQIFPSFLRTSSKYSPPLILALPKKTPSNYSPGGTCSRLEASVRIQTQIEEIQEIFSSPSEPPNQ